MDRHKRMAQVLGCLVASMTVGAMVLQWGQPASVKSANVAPVELIASAITHPWHAVHVRFAGPDGRFDPKETHFFVDCQGRWSATESWRSQSQTGGQGIIRIALEPPPNTNQIAGPQWTTTQQLRDILCKECRISARDVKFQDNLVTPPTPEERESATVRLPSARQANALRNR